MSLFDAIGSLFTSGSNNKAITKASQAQTDAFNKALAAQQQGQAQADTAITPFLTTGTSALSRLASLYGLADGGTYENGQIVGGVNGGYNPDPTAVKSSLTNTPGGYNASDKQEWDNYLAQNPDVAASYQKQLSNPGFQGNFPTAEDFAAWHYSSGGGQQEGRVATPTVTTTPATGASATGADPFATFYQSPDFNFRLGQGINGVDAGAAARGALDSGATRKAEIAYAGNLASGEYQNYKNGLMQLAGVGQTAAGQTANVATGTANNITTLNTNQGNNLASSYLAKAANNANTIGTITGYLNGGGGSQIANGIGSAFNFLTTPIAGFG